MVSPQSEGEDVGSAKGNMEEDSGRLVVSGKIAGRIILAVFTAATISFGGICYNLIIDNADQKKDISYLNERISDMEEGLEDLIDSHKSDNDKLHTNLWTEINKLRDRFNRR